MNYVYLLESLDEERVHYIGSTNDLKRRFAEHNNGKGGKTTRHRKWKLLYYEAYETLEMARKREHQLKQHRGSLRALYTRLGV